MSDRALEEFYAALLEDDPEELYERAPCGYLTTDADGLILKVNQTFLTLTGYARDALVGRRRFADLLTAGGKIYHETHFAPMLQIEGRAREIAFDLVRADGERLPVLVNAVLVRRPEVFSGVIRTAVFDATNRREYERELLRAKQRAEEAAAHANALARTLQQTLIPPAPPQVPELDVAAVYRPAGNGEEVGGDFYDVFEIEYGDWAVVLGDVCGKGVGAAVVTALARYTLRAAAVRHDEPSNALRSLNEVMLRDEHDRFCTVVFARLRLDETGWSATLGCAGHPSPLLMRAGQRPEPVGQPGSLIGVIEQVSLHDTWVRLRPGDCLVFFTDGVTEARRGSDFFGAERFADAVMAARGSAGSVAYGVLDEVLEFQADNPRDDIAIVAVAVPD